MSVMLYKTPGIHETNGGITFDYIVVEEDDVSKNISKGWCKTLPQDVELEMSSKKKRDELEVKAKDMGVKFNKRTTDEKLEKLTSTKEVTYELL